MFSSLVCAIFGPGSCHLFSPSAGSNHPVISAHLTCSPAFRGRSASPPLASCSWMWFANHLTSSQLPIPLSHSPSNLLPTNVGNRTLCKLFTCHYPGLFTKLILCPEPTDASLPRLLPSTAVSCPHRHYQRVRLLFEGNILASNLFHGHILCHTDQILADKNVCEYKESLLGFISFQFCFSSSPNQLLKGSCNSQKASGNGARWEAWWHTGRTTSLNVSYPSCEVHHIKLTNTFLLSESNLVHYYLESGIFLLCVMC